MAKIAIQKTEIKKYMLFWNAQKSPMIFFCVFCDMMIHEYKLSIIM